MTLKLKMDDSCQDEKQESGMKEGTNLSHPVFSFFVPQCEVIAKKSCLALKPKRRDGEYIQSRFCAMIRRFCLERQKI